MQFMLAAAGWSVKPPTSSDDGIFDIEDVGRSPGAGSLPSIVQFRCRICP
jgi:hypothetical protein